jgi:hypothetical protein
VRFGGFVGPSATEWSANVNLERTLNLYPQILGRKDGTPKTRTYLMGTPGSRPFLALPSGPVRGLFAQDGRAFAVVGALLYELFANQTAIVRGSVASDGRPASMASNGAAGHQLIVCSAGLGYIFDLITADFTQITAAGFPNPCAMVGFSDGYFVALQGQSNVFYISDLEDGLSWDAADKGQVSESSNQLRSLIINNRVLWLLGSQTTEVWYNAGDAAFPFAPIQGSFLQRGIDAAFSATRLDTDIAFIGRDEHGPGIVYRSAGYGQVRRISTSAIEEVLRESMHLNSDQVVSWSYQDLGHPFYLLNVPGARSTWVYDGLTDLWHERSILENDGIQESPIRGQCHCHAFGKHLVGDRLSGVIYEQSLDFFDDQLVVA